MISNTEVSFLQLTGIYWKTISPARMPSTSRQYRHSCHDYRKPKPLIASLCQQSFFILNVSLALGSRSRFEVFIPSAKHTSNTLLRMRDLASHVTSAIGQGEVCLRDMSSFHFSLCLSARPEGNFRNYPQRMNSGRICGVSSLIIASWKRGFQTLMNVCRSPPSFLSKSSRIGQGSRPPSANPNAFKAKFVLLILSRPRSQLCLI